MALSLPPHYLQSQAASPVLSVSLNADGTLFGSAETGGWRVWETATRRCLASKEAKGSYSLALPLHQTNIIFLVGGPPSPAFPSNRVVVWDEEVEEVVLELPFDDEVVGLAARRDRLIVVTLRRVFVYALGEGEPGAWQEAVYETTGNPRGLVAVATLPSATLLAIPGRQSGHVQLIRLPPLDKYPLQPSKRPVVFPSTSILIAHTSSLAALCCTPSGNLVATASSKGTLVRVWDVATSQLVRELRRGTDTADIFGLSLRPDGGALAVSSDKGTVHVWRLANEEQEKKPRSSEEDSSSSSSRRPITLSTLKPYLPKYFSSEWSHSQFRLPPPAVPLTRFSTVPDETPSIEDDICKPFWRPSPDDKTKFDLILLTQSGGLFRISTSHLPPILKAKKEEKGKGPQRSSSTTPAMWGPSAEGDLKLEEYRRWGGEEGWDW